MVLQLFQPNSEKGHFPAFPAIPAFPARVDTMREYDVMERAGTTFDEPPRLDIMKQSPNCSLTCSLGYSLKFCSSSMQS